MCKTTPRWSSPMDLVWQMISLYNSPYRSKSRMITTCETWGRSYFRPTRLNSTKFWYRIQRRQTRLTRNLGSSTTSLKKSAKTRSRKLRTKSAAFRCQRSARWKVQMSPAPVYNQSLVKSAWLRCRLASTSAETICSTLPRPSKRTQWHSKTKTKAACS